LKKIHDIVLKNRRVKTREIAEIIGVSTERVYNMLQKNLNVKKLFAKWAPYLLTIDKK